MIAKKTKLKRIVGDIFNVSIGPNQTNYDQLWHSFSSFPGIDNTIRDRLLLSLIKYLDQLEKVLEEKSDIKMNLSDIDPTKYPPLKR